MNMKRIIFMIGLFSIAYTLTSCDLFEDYFGSDEKDEIIKNENGNEEEDPNEELEQVQLALDTTYVEGSSTFIFSNGIAINCSRDTTAHYRIALNQLNLETKTWENDKAIAIYCDSLYNPTFAINNEYIYHLTKIAEDNYEVHIFNKDLTLIKHVESVQLSRPVDTRASTTKEQITIRDGVQWSLIAYELVEEYQAPSSLGPVSIAVGLLNNIPEESIMTSLVDMSLGTADIIRGARIGYLGVFLAYADFIEHLIKAVTKFYIGDISPWLEDICVIGKNSALVKYFHDFSYEDNIKCAPYFKILYWYEVDGRRVGSEYCATESIVENNLLHNINVNNLHGGTVAFQIIVYPDIFCNHEILQKIYCFKSEIKRIEMPSIVLMDIKQIDTKYKANEDIVEITMDINLEFASEHDRTVLQYTDNDYGVYYEYDGEIKYISAKKHNRLEFSDIITFPGKDFDIQTRTAFLKDLVDFGCYSKDSYGIIKHYRNYDYDTQVLYLMYDRAPSITISNVIVTEAGPYSDEDGRDRYINYTYEITYEGGLIIDKIIKKLGTGWEDSGTEYDVISKFDDGFKQTRNGTIHYYSVDNSTGYIYFYALLGNGDKYQFPTGLVFNNGNIDSFVQTDASGINNIIFETLDSYYKPKLITF